MRTGYLECFSGISGDMLLGALVDAGVPFNCLEQTAAALNVGARLEMRKVSRGGLAATKVDVITPDQMSEPAHTHEEPAAHTHEEPHTHSHGEPHSHSHEGQAAHSHDGHAAHTHEAHIAPLAHSHTEPHSHAHHRSLSAILAIIAAAPLSDAVKQRASRAFQLLGEAEAAIHSMPIEKVHFHEVGAVDTIVDIVCGAAGAEALGVDRWLASPLNVGSGTVDCQHGTLPVPAPATLALLGDAPVYAAGPPMERVTPTGAAILKMLDVQYGPLPAMRVKSTGYGAGGRETPGQPNLLRLLVGEEDAADSVAADSIAVIETVIDDSSPELLGYVSEQLLAAGAWDVYRASVQMKKGRTGVQMTVLCRPDLMPALRDLLLRETTSIGLRWRLENKMALAREFAVVQTQWGAVKIKIARWPNGDEANAAPEYEDCRKIATEHAVPLKHVMQQAMREFAAVNKK
ncbi:MAG: nickel pincer cofactor biosynthesis protein LarC [Terracidiphilus sp.]|nr:nickel pincer cofactor biosynthesis protein LarC [Terracidiphilus sp.]